jgi:hypothetical protein
MGELKGSTEEILVHLVRPGLGVQDYHLAEGAAEPWRAAVHAFRDESLFREYSEALKALRHGDDPEEGQGG